METTIRMFSVSLKVWKRVAAHDLSTLSTPQQYQLNIHTSQNANVRQVAAQVSQFLKCHGTA